MFLVSTTVAKHFNSTDKNDDKYYLYINTRTMKERKIDYTAPAMEVVEVQFQSCLLAGSYTTNFDGTMTVDDSVSEYD